MAAAMNDVTAITRRLIMVLLRSRGRGLPNNCSEVPLIPAIQNRRTCKPLRRALKYRRGGTEGSTR